MPIEFTQYPSPENTGVSGDTLFRLTVAYDGTGRRISKTRWVKAQGDAGWSRGHVTHYTGIGTEVRENFAELAKETKVVVNMPVFFRVTLTRLKPRSYIEKDILRLSNGGAILPKQSFGASRQGLGRYGIEDADRMAEDGSAQTFEWFLKNHLGSTMLVYGTGGTSGGLKAAYDYRSFGEQIELTTPPTGKVTENFTGKELDDETQLDYFGARYLDPMLGVWISVDPMRQFASPYLYVGNGMNPVNAIDPDGKAPYQIAVFVDILRAESEKPTLDSYRDFQAAAKWGREKFGEDFEIRIIWNQKEMLDFVKAGKYTAIIAHTLLDRKGNPEQGTLVNREKDYDQIDLYRLDFDLFEINSYAKVFACGVGRWDDLFDNIDLGSNKGPLHMGDAYQDAADYLMENKPDNNK